MSERWVVAPGTGSRIRATVIAILAPGLALILALIVQPERELGAASLFVLAVVAASVFGGIWAGIGSSLLGFLALNYFFTEPVHTLRVHNRDDVVALAVFLVVALMVGWVVARAVAERDRATRREREARLLNLFATKALSGEPLDRVLDDLAAALVDALRLVSCSIHAEAAGRTFDVHRTRPGAVEAGRSEVAISSGEHAFGTLTAATESQDGSPPEDRRLLQAAASQIAAGLERARLDAEIAAARLEAETSQARAALFSSVTHDLRTPLASITASASSLLEPGVPFTDDQARDLLRTILEEAERLNRLVGNLMDLSRMRAGALTPDRVAVPVGDVIASVLARLAHHLAGRPVRVMVRDDVPPVPIDVVQLDQVVTNLIENAMRYSPPGSEIAISAIRWERWVEVRVSDHGPGIPTEDREAVFQEFYRRDVDGRKAGTGLGLSIARAVIAAHDGSMWVETTPGGGATIGFRLPLAAQGADVPLSVLPSS